MATPLGATFLYWVSRRALRWCYREIHYFGREQIPTTGPVLLIGNHPNDLPDVLAGLFTTKRHVRYVATLSATVLPLATATYRAMGVIPVMRVRDVRMMRARGVDVGTVNAEAFETVRRAFADHDVVAIFPEGGVHDTPHIGHIRSGVSKMALLGLESGAENGVTIVPFGVQYEAPRTLRSDLTVVVGRPFSLASWSAGGPREDGQSGHAALTTTLREALVAVTRNNHTWATSESRDRLIPAIAAVVASADEPLPFAATRVQARCAQLVGTAESPSAENSRTPVPGSLADHWPTAADTLGNAVERAGGIRTSARDTARVLDAAGAVNGHADWPSVPWLVATALPAVIGLVLHAPLWYAVRRVAQRLTVVRTDSMAKAILPGLHLIFLGYLALGGVFALAVRAAGWSGWWALALLVLLPTLGDLGLSWRDAVRTTRLRARVRGWPASDRAAIVTEAERLRAAWHTLF